jgi:transposase InsO family protein
MDGNSRGVGSLDSLYYDPRTGFVSESKFAPRNPDKTRREVREFLEAQAPHQLLKQPRRPRTFPSITAPFPGYSFQIDIMVYDRYTFHNYKYILDCIDVHSRYVTARPLTNRQAPTIVKALRSMFDEMGVPLHVNCDQEFVQAKEIRTFFDRNGVTVYASDPDEPRKNALIERFHRTLALMLQRWRLSESGLRNWPKVLPDIIENYNTSLHRTIGATPAQVFRGEVASKQVVVRPKPPSRKIGDLVRVLSQKQTFDKGDAPRYSKDVYKVIAMEGNRYLLRNQRTDAQPRRRYKEDELNIAEVQRAASAALSSPQGVLPSAAAARQPSKRDSRTATYPRTREISDIQRMQRNLEPSLPQGMTPYVPQTRTRKARQVLDV